MKNKRGADKRRLWWRAFVKEIEAIGGHVKNELMVHDESEVEIAIPEDRLDDARAIMARFWDPDRKCARPSCVGEPLHVHKDGGRYCTACARKINAAYQAMGFAGVLVEIVASPEA